MSTSQIEKPLHTYRIKSGSMWCHTCDQQTVAKWTMKRIYKEGREVERQMCSECNVIQETEYFTGPTVKIKNREKKKK